MSAKYEILKELGGPARLKEAFALDVLNGLSETPKRIPSKYFYDAEGSRLFQAITDLPEYYLTRCEFEIFENYKGQIANIFEGKPFNLVELGPGDARKTMVLMEYFLQSELNFQYVPIDISESAMQELTQHLNARFPKLNVHGFVSNYSNALNWLKSLNSQSNFVLFLGSNIGNFNRPAAGVFLRSLWNSLSPNDYFLIGFDLKKDIEILLNAYNDTRGITGKFNLNLLNRINRELGGNFDLSRFRHYANYDVFSGAMESYLVSLEEQVAFLENIGQSFSFDSWEPIHTEYSYKYLNSDIETLASRTGFVIQETYYDSQRYFCDSIWRVQKNEKQQKATAA